MESRVTTHDVHGSQDEHEWELSDEELDRRSDDVRGFFCTTSRPCTCTRCACR
jgi:hypothetical protein